MRHTGHKPFGLGDMRADKVLGEHRNVVEPFAQGGVRIKSPAFNIVVSSSPRNGAKVIPVELPYWNGPQDVLHLMSFISLSDDDLAVVYRHIFEHDRHSAALHAIRPRSGRFR